MDRITAAQVFIAIVEQGSLIKAADALGMSRSMVTRYLSEMERWADAGLIHRSTRRLTVTDAGTQILDSCYKLADIEKDVRFASSSTTRAPQGLLRISTSRFFGERILLPFSSAFLSRYPDVSLDFQISNQAVNLVEDRIDLAIRITNSLDPNVIARKFGVLKSVICAAPAYLQTAGYPMQPDHLSRHQCLIYSYFGKRSWTFLKGEEVFSVPVSGSLSADDLVMLLEAALMGKGITFQPLLAVEPYFGTQDLVPLLTEYQVQPIGIYGIYKSRKHMSRALRLFIDELAPYIKTIAL